MFGWNKQYKWGIALGGGGARGYAHLGVLEALREKNIKPDVIAGVSAGAIAGAFIASGKTPREAFEAITKYSFNDFTKFKIPKNGLLSLEKMRSTLEKEIEAETFEELEIPLIITCTNVLTGKVEYIKEGPLSESVVASASIPVLFDPVELDGKVLMDGGLLNNLPFQPLLETCKKVIAVSISPVQELEKVDGLIDVAARTFQLSVNSRREEARKSCKYFIEPPRLCEFDLLDTSNAEEIFQVGYEYTKEMDM